MVEGWRLKALALGKEELRNKVHEPLAGTVCQDVPGICCHLPHSHVGHRGGVWLVEVMSVAGALGGGLGLAKMQPSSGDLALPVDDSIATSNDQPFCATPNFGPRAAHHGVRIWLERG